MSNTQPPHPSTPASTRPRNPYVGPRTFSEADARYFFGREREARDLLSLVISEPLVLFYAQSGAGKSSLLHARLIPALREEEFEVLPIGRVAGGLPAEGLRPSNIFVFNLLLSIDDGRTPPLQLAHLSLGDYIAQRRATLEPQTALVLIVDQFEEILTTHVARWQEREAFFQQLGQALREDSLLWVVLSLRDDYVAALDPFAVHLPNKFRGRFYMQRMTTDAALHAIERPAAGAGRPFAPGVAQTLVHNLAQIRTRTGEVAGEFVQPVQMQVVCFQLWENLAQTDLPQITAEALRDLGDVNAALGQFYEQSLSATAQATGIKPKQLRDWFTRELITEAGTRGLVFQGNTETGGLPNSAVADLEKRYLIRGEWRGGNLWYELTHDRFIEPIQKANAAWYAARRARWMRWAASAAGSLILLLVCVVALLQTTNSNRPVASDLGARTTVEAEAAATVIVYQQEAADAQAQAANAQAQAAEVAITATAEAQLAAADLAQRNATATASAATLQAELLIAQATADARATVEFAIAATATSQSTYLVTIAQAVQEQSTLSDPNVVEAIAQTTFTTMDSQTRLDSLSTLLLAEQPTYDVPLTSYAASAADLFNGLSPEEQINLFATTDVNGQRALLELAMRRTLRLVGNNDTDLLGAMQSAASQSRLNADLAAVLDNWWNGRISAESGQYDTAVHLFDAALLQQPDNPILLMDRARAYAELEQTQNALNDYLAALGYLNVVAWDGETLSCTGQSQNEGDMVALLGRIIFDQPAVWDSLQALEARYPVLEAVARPLFANLPSDSTQVTQPFGVNATFYSRFGTPGHFGVDFSGVEGVTPVYAVAKGQVSQIGFEANGYGHHVYITHSWGCISYTTIYAQMFSIDEALRIGDEVSAGQQVGLLGNTGASSGAHLHFEFRSPQFAEPGWPRLIADPTPYLWPFLVQSSSYPEGPYHSGWVAEWAVMQFGDLVLANAGGVSLRSESNQNSQRLFVVPEGVVMIVTGEAANNFFPVNLSINPPSNAQLGDEWVRIKDGMVMVYVSPPSQPLTLGRGIPAPTKGFWIDKYEVSNSQYQLCVDDGACSSSFFANDNRFNNANQPVVGVSWFDAVAYGEWAGGRLPSEAEWEYAAVGEMAINYPWGDEFDGTRLNFCDVNCFNTSDDGTGDDGYQYTAPVDSYPSGASWVGVLNMSGNVYEWTSSPFDNDSFVLRGGSWLNTRINVRISNRRSSVPLTWESSFGMRLVYTVDSSSQ